MHELGIVRQIVRIIAMKMANVFQTSNALLNVPTHAMKTSNARQSQNALLNAQTHAMKMDNARQRQSALLNVQIYVMKTGNARQRQSVPKPAKPTATTKVSANVQTHARIHVQPMANVPSCAAVKSSKKCIFPIMKLTFLHQVRRHERLPVRLYTLRLTKKPTIWRMPPANQTLC